MAVIAQNSTNLPYLSVYRIDNYPFTLIAKIDSVKANFDIFTSGNFRFRKCFNFKEITLTLLSLILPLQRELLYIVLMALR